MSDLNLPQKRQQDQSTIKIVSWNVCGIRALFKKKDLFSDLIQRENPDILCLNETRLQESQVEEIKRNLPGQYFPYFACSSTKKGYSGVAILSKIEPISVNLQGIQQHDNEGRILIAEFSEFFLIATYVPCAGERLKRLDYRVQVWDSDLKTTIKQLSEHKKVVWCGDLNVVNEEVDIYSLKGKEKSGCCTPQERNSFKKTLNDCGLIDTFRILNPELKKYSYYPRRNVRAKEKGQGWRLDYILVSESLKPNIKAADIKNEYEGSDHYPVVTVLSI